MKALWEEFLNVNGLQGPDFDDTPERVSRFWNGFLHPEEPRWKSFPSKCLKEVTLKKFTEWGMCPHHLLPVKYTFHISYTPSGRVLGISKLPRLAKWILKDLPLQEDIPHLLIHVLKNIPDLNPKSISVSVDGYHLCMVMRGVRAQDAVLTTSDCWVSPTIATAGGL